MTDINISMINQLSPEGQQALIHQETIEKTLTVIMVIVIAYIFFN